MNVFTRAARVGSISAAARTLNLSASMATKHLDALEAKLGVRLFQRSTRKLSLTEAGQQYLQALNRLLPELEEVENRLASLRVEATGILRLNAPLSFGARYIAPLIGEFHRQHPDVIVELGLNDRVVDLIEEGWDLTIRTGPLADSRLVSRQLADCRMVICAAPSYWHRAGTPQVPADLCHHNCLGSMISSIAGIDEWRFGSKLNHKVAVSGALRANNGDALLAAAVAGLGVIYEPEFIVADALTRGELERVELGSEPVLLGGIHLVYSTRQAFPAKMRVMTTFLVDAFREHCPWDTRKINSRQRPD
ncbi:LysR family transcriptional regulator [Yersinia canariae]|nr:LysR family transcriptional regulator [Yersinia canariae]